MSVRVGTLAKLAQLEDEFRVFAQGGVSRIK